MTKKARRKGKETTVKEAAETVGDVATNVARPVLGVGEVVAEAMAPPGVAVALKALKALLEVCEQYKHLHSSVDELREYALTVDSTLRSMEITSASIMHRIHTITLVREAEVGIIEWGANSRIRRILYAKKIEEFITGFRTSLEGQIQLLVLEQEQYSLRMQSETQTTTSKASRRLKTLESIITEHRSAVKRFENNVDNDIVLLRKALKDLISGIFHLKLLSYLTVLLLLWLCVFRLGP